MKDQQSVDLIVTLRNHGFKISIDDFGTGYSCLSYLTHIDVDSIKIDMCFVRKVFENKKCMSVVKNILHLCRSSMSRPSPRVSKQNVTTTFLKA